MRRRDLRIKMLVRGELFVYMIKQHEQTRGIAPRVCLRNKTLFSQPPFRVSAFHFDRHSLAAAARDLKSRE
jgi:hypothetical protein